MPDKTRRLEVILAFVKQGDPDALRRAVQLLEQAVKDFGTAGEGSAKKIAVLQAKIKQLQSDTNKTVQEGNNLSKSFSKAGDAAYHFGMGAMWLNLPMTRFIYLAGNTIQGLQWMQRGFSEVLKELSPLAKALMVGTVGVTGIGVAMVATSRSARQMTDAMRMLSEVTGRGIQDASRLANSMAGVLGTSGAIQSSVQLARIQSSMDPGQRELQRSQALGVRPGQTNPWFADPFAQIGIPLHERGGKPREMPDILIGSAQRLLAMNEGVRARQLNRFDPETTEKLTMIMELLKKESPETIKARGTGLFAPTDKERQSLVAYKLASIELSNAWNSFMAEMGKDIIPLFTAFIRMLTSVVQGISGVTKAIGGGIPTFVALGAVVLAVTAKVGGLLRLFAPLGRLLGRAGPIGGGITLISGLLRGDLVTAILGIVGLLGSRALLGSLLAAAGGLATFASGLGAVLLIIGAVTVGLYLLWPAIKPFGEALKSMFGDLKNVDVLEWAKRSKKGFDDFGAGLGQAIARMLAFLEALRQMAAESTRGAYNFAVNLVTGGALPSVSDRQVNWDVLLRMRSEPADALDALAKIQPKTVDVNAILKMREEPSGAIDALAKIQPKTVDINTVLKLNSREVDSWKPPDFVSKLTFDVEDRASIQRRVPTWFEAMLKLNPDSRDTVQRKLDDQYGPRGAPYLFIEANVNLPSQGELQRKLDERGGSRAAPYLFLEANVNLPSRDVIQNNIDKITKVDGDLLKLGIGLDVPGGKWSVQQELDKIAPRTGEDRLKIGLGIDLPHKDEVQRRINQDYTNMFGRMGLKLPSPWSIYQSLPEWLRIAIGGFGTTDSPITVNAPYGARGAIVNRPTLALIGEKGREAVVPLDRTLGNDPLGNEGMGGRRTPGITVTNVFNISAMDFADPAAVERIARKVGDRIVNNVRILTGGARVT